MSTGAKLKKCVGVFVLCLFVCVGSASYANTSTTHTQHKTKKPAPLPPLPSGPQGPVPQIPLDSIAPVAPQVTYDKGQLTIVAPNSTLGDILRAVHKQTGAEIEVPVATERVVTRLGPGPARDVVAELLNGSRFNYVLLGSPEDSSLLTRVVLVAKSGVPSPADAGNPNNQPGGPPPGMVQAGNLQPQPQPDMAQDDAEAAADDAPADDNSDQAAEADQAAAPADQQGVKTPQQMLQEMQQRQLQLQQQQTPGQPPIPGARPPQEQQ